MLRFRMRMSLRILIMFIVIDRSAHIVLPLIDLLMLLRGQMTTVGRTIIRSLVVDARLAVLDVPGLAPGHLPRTDTLGNALLLVHSPLPWS